MIESNNGESPVRSQKRHNAKLCSLAIRERIVNALANGDSKRAIARTLRVSNNTVDAVAEQDWQRVEARKARIAAQAERAATKAFDRINDKLSSSDDIPLNTLVPVAGVSVDKLTILRGDPSLHIQHDVFHHRDEELIINLIKAFKLDPTEFIQKIGERSKSNNDVLLCAMNVANAVAEKRAKARGVELPALPPGDASVAGENRAQKEG